jgi:hypothetical protein
LLLVAAVGAPPASDCQRMQEIQGVLPLCPGARAAMLHAALKPMK